MPTTFASELTSFGNGVCPAATGARPASTAGPSECTPIQSGDTAFARQVSSPSLSPVGAFEPARNAQQSNQIRFRY